MSVRSRAICKQKVDEDDNDHDTGIDEPGTIQENRFSGPQFYIDRNFQTQIFRKRL